MGTMCSNLASHFGSKHTAPVIHLAQGSPMVPGQPNNIGGSLSTVAHQALSFSRFRAGMAMQCRWSIWSKTYNVSHDLVRGSCDPWLATAPNLQDNTGGACAQHIPLFRACKATPVVHWAENLPGFKARKAIPVAPVVPSFPRLWACNATSAARFLAQASHGIGLAKQHRWFM